jgi:hypothetical protein
MFALNAWFWLNVVNALLGLVVAYYLGRVVLALVRDLSGGRKEEATIGTEVRRKAA